MNSIGFNLLTWSETLSDKLYPSIERLKSIGYDGIEYAMGSDDVDDYRKLGTFLDEIGMACTCVLAVGPEENPASSESSVRDAALDRIRWTIDRAGETGASVICGPFHSAFAHFTQAAPTADEQKRSAEVLRRAGEYAAEANVVLALEALNRFECYLCNTSNQLLGLVEEVDHPNVRAMFDTHHANIEEKSFGDAIRRLSPYLTHVHISENDRGTPGDGHVNWDEVFGTLADVAFDGWLTIEAFTREDPDFANAINVWRSYSKPWEIAVDGHAFIKSKIAETSIQNVERA